MRKQNHYYKTRKRLTKKKAPSINALKLFMQGLMAGVGMARHLALSPIPRFPKGGVSHNGPSILGESGKELAWTPIGMQIEAPELAYLKAGTTIKFDPANLKETVHNSLLAYDPKSLNLGDWYRKQILTGGIKSKS